MRVTWPGPSACGDPRLEHFPEKWTPVFRQGNATNIESRALSVYGACDFMVNLNGKRSSACIPRGCRLHGTTGKTTTQAVLDRSIFCKAWSPAGPQPCARVDR